MALTTAQQAQQLFKASQGKSSTNVVRDFFEEPRDGRPIVYPANIWAESVKIPVTAPGGVDAAITGVVQRFIAKTLTAIPGTTNSFFHADLVDCIPFNTGDGSYNYALTDSTGAAIPFGLGDWIVDPNTGTLTFYSTVPANMPPKLSFYKYVGLKGSLPPRYTAAEIAALPSPIAGQQVFNTTTNQINVYSGTAWAPVGAGGGGSGDGAINYISNGKAETDTVGWVAFDGSMSQPQANLGNGTVDELGDVININTSAQIFRDNQPVVYTTTGTAIGGLTNGSTYYIANPLPGTGSTCGFSLRFVSGGAIVDLTGEGTGTHTFTPLVPAFTTSGTPAVTITRTTVSPIRGTASFVMTKPAQNCRGQGISTGFNIDSADKGKLCFYSLEIDIPTGLALGDLTWYVLDATTGASIDGALVTPIATAIQSIGVTFTPPIASGVAYRLAGFVSSTSATAWTQKFDSVTAGPVTTPTTVFTTNPDSVLRINGFTSLTVGSTATNVGTISNGSTIVENSGDAIQYLTDSVLGMRVVFLRDGYASVSMAFDGGGTTDAFRITKNATVTTGSWQSGPVSEVLAVGYGDVPTASWSGPVKANDVIRFHPSTAVLAGSTYSNFTAAFVGNVKSVQAIPGQKIRIPTSELRFENASTRGTVDTAIVKWDNLTKLTGDAFEIVNTAANGTFIRMKKAGHLTLNSNFVTNAAGGFNYLSRNQAVLTAQPTLAECLSQQGAGASSGTNEVAWSGIVSIGDVFRCVSNAGTSTGSQYLTTWTAAFFETEISVAINTVQPQWSQSDSVSRVVGFAAAGSVYTQVPRFSNVLENQGGDITYLPSVTLGDSWLINTTGLYNYRFNGCNNSTPVHIAVARGAVVDFTSAQANPNDLLAIDTTGSSGYFACASGQDYLTAGTVVRCMFNGTGPNGTNASFTISKAGKPNLTSADITPFATNYKTMDTETAYGNGGVAGATIVTFNQWGTQGKGILSINTAGNRVTALRRCNLVVSWAWNASGVSGNTIMMICRKVGNDVQLGQNANNQTYNTTSAAPVQLEANEYIEFYGSSSNSLNSAQFRVLAFADVDAVISTNKQVSSDNTSFVFKSTAINPESDPIGTFNTYTYAANTNTPVIATAAPTQSTSDMSLNGFRLYTRIYTASSTAALPARVDIFVGKGLKSVNLDAYAAAGKLNPVAYDYALVSNATMGARKTYSESTGILSIEAASSNNGSETIRDFRDNTGASFTSAYLVFNASIAPALVATRTTPTLGLRYTLNSGTLTGTQSTLLYNTKKWDNSGGAYNPANGVFTAPFDAEFSFLAGILTAQESFAAGTNLEMELLSTSAEPSIFLDRPMCDATVTKYWYCHGIASLQMLKGQTAYIGMKSTKGTTQIHTDARFNYLEIKRTGDYKT